MVTVTINNPTIQHSHSRSPLISLITILLFITSYTAPQAASSSLKIGLGETVITPRENVQMAGFARSQVSTGVHDDLHARSLVIESKDGTSAVMMTISLVSIGRTHVEQIRAGIHEKTGIPEKNILISANHTHSGPRVGRSGKEYETFVIERTVESVVEAWNNRAPCRIGIGSTDVQELGRNRRRLLYGGLHPDPEVGLIKIENAQGKLIGVAFNYGCHPSALDWRNRLLSEDWPYYAIQGIKKELGNDIWVAYYQGAEGDINVGYMSELSAVGVYMPIRNYQYIEVKGYQMADAVIKALPDIATSGNHEIKMTTDFFEYPLRKSYPIPLEQAEIEAETAQKKLAEMESDSRYEGTRLLDDARVEVFQTQQRLRGAKRFNTRENRPSTTDIEQQALRIGDAVFVSLPGEVFSEIGLRIKEESPLEKTFLIGLANGYGGYMPTAKEFIEGDYEVNGSRYSPETESVCVKSSIELIKRIMK